ncbi:hypothetical protein HY636_05615 [Candidatus Woesearchaeota archaeon]|nr:hypothetical protein [Candidatus Woesearchaeota archaeon]
MQEQYLIEHIRKYVEFEMQQGYQLKDIKEALINYGYNSGLVAHAINPFLKGLRQVKPKTQKQASAQQLREMNDEMYFYIQNMLIDYIKQQMNKGYSVKAIKGALLRAGHHEDMLNKAIKFVQQGKVIDYENPIKTILPAHFLLVVSLFLLVVLTLFVSISTDENLLKVLLTLMPGFFGVLLTYTIITSTTSTPAKLASSKNRLLVQLTPLLATAIVVVLFVILTQYTFIYQTAQSTTLLLLNAVPAFILSGFMCMLAPKEK